VRKEIIAGNWKMNKTPKQALELIEVLKSKVGNPERDVVFCTPFVDLYEAKKALDGTGVYLGAQNMYFEDSGAYTGEISAEMLKEIGVTHVILGHSERRQYFGETDQIVNKKVLQAIKYNLVPIICVGETLSQRESGITIDLVRMQVKIALQNIQEADAVNTVIAYEPIWAIGTGKTATAAQAEEVCAAIRGALADIYNEGTAQKIRIQYGGSVTASNARELFGMENIDGGLVGGASLKEEFSMIVNYK
jgi:triosephosphate isomerase